MGLSDIEDLLQKTSRTFALTIPCLPQPTRDEVAIAYLRAYCYAVAGIVGEMLTELFVLGRPGMQAVAGDLRKHAAAFGEGLQLVNILKDARPDAVEGRTFLPRQAPLREVFVLARQD